MFGRLRGALARPVDGAAIAAFRIAFGALLCIGTVRMLASGYVREAFLVPRMFFPPWPLESVLRPLPGYGMYAVLAAIALLSAGLALGMRTRLCSGLLCILFTYAHFIDLTNYLNHYWLVTLLTALLAVLPGTDAAPSLDARARRGSGRGDDVPAWVLYTLRFQLGVVYTFAGLAKLKHDWLFLAQPMRIWLAANTDFPLLGPLLREPWLAYAMSWSGALYDLTICGWLLWPRSRPIAYVTVVAFHLITARLFNIGMFPFFMIAASSLFLDPAWLRRQVRWTRSVAVRERPRRAPLAWLMLYAIVQVALPLRARLYGGNPLWHEQGYRFGWNVMLMEKMGAAEISTVDRASGRRRFVRLREYLTPSQEKAMATQPDLILSFARRLKQAERREGRDVQVYADVYVVLNGRPGAPLVDRAVDLGAEEDGLGAKRWILPTPE